MADKESSVVLNFKSEGAIQMANTVKELNTIMNTAAKQYRAQVSAMDANASATEKLGAAQQKLSTQYEAAQRRTKMLTDEYNDLKNSGNASTAALAKQAGKVADAERAENSLKNQLDKANQGLTEQGQKSSEAKSKLDGLKSEASLLEAQQRKLDSEFALQRKELGQNASESDKMELAQKQLGQQTQLTEKYIGNLERQLKETEAAYGANSREATEMATKLNNAKTSVSNVESQMKSMDSTTSHSSGALGTFREKLSLGAVAGAASNAVSNLTGGLGSLVSQAADSSDAIEKFDSTMKGAGFGEPQIKKASATMKKYADDTVYDTNTVMNTTAQLAANGIKNYSELTQAAGNMNAQFGGTQDTFHSVAMVMTQTAGAGKLTTENWNQLADAIPGASGKLQEAMKKNGAYTGNFRDAMQKGQISSDEFNAAVTQLGMNKGAVEAAKSTSTFEGAVGQMQANVVNGIQKIIDTIGKANMTNMINTISNGIVGALNVLVGALKLVANHADTFKTLAVAVGTFFAVFKTVSVVTAAIGAINKFKSAIVAGEGVMKAFGAVMAINPFVLIIGAIAAVVAALVYFFTQTKTGKKAWQEFTTWLGNLWKGLKETATNIFNGLADFFKKWGPTILAVMTGPIGLMVKFIIDHWNQIKETTSNVFNAIKEFLGNLWNGIKNTISNVVNGIKSTVSNVWNAISNTTSSIWNGIQNVTGSIWNGIKSVIESVVNAVKSTVSNVWDGIKNVTSDVWNGIQSVSSSVWNSIKSTIESVVNGIRNTVSNVWNGIKNVTSSVWNGIKSAMESPVRAAENTISGIINRIKGFFSGLHLSFPRISMPPLPHFRLSGSFSLKPPSVPHLGVDWYAKGGIFTRPTIFGADGGGLKGAGEAGPEAALPLNAETLAGIGKGIASNMPQGGGDVYLQVDGRTFAKLMGPYMDRAIGSIHKNAQIGLGGI